MEPSSPPQAPLQKKRAPRCCYKKALFNRSFPRDFTFFCFVFEHQFLGMHSPDSTGWEKVKHRSCQEGSVGRHPCRSQLCLL